MGALRTAARYEAFIREGAKVNYRAEWSRGAVFRTGALREENRQRNSPAVHLPARDPEGFAEECGSPVGSSRRDIASQGPTGKRSKCPRSIHPRSRIGAGLSRFPGRRFSFLPSVKRKPSTADELVDLGKSDTTALLLLLFSHPAGSGEDEWRKARVRRVQKGVRVQKGGKGSERGKGVKSRVD
jgi:hypothetical protein